MLRLPPSPLMIVSTPTVCVSFSLRGWAIPTQNSQIHFVNARVVLPVCVGTCLEKSLHGVSYMFKDMRDRPASRQSRESWAERRQRGRERKRSAVRQQLFSVPACASLRRVFRFCYSCRKFAKQAQHTLHTRRFLDWGLTLDRCHGAPPTTELTSATPSGTNRYRNT